MIATIGALFRWIREIGGDRAGQPEWAHAVEAQNRIGHQQPVALLPRGPGALVVVNSSSGGGGHYRPWLVELDGSGKIVAENVLKGQHEVFARATVNAPDGGFYVAGEQDRGDRHYQGWMLHVGAGRRIEAEVSLGRAGNTALTALRRLADGDLIAAGVQDGRGWLLRVAPDLSVRWEKEIPSVGIIYSLWSRDDGALFLAGAPQRPTLGSGVTDVYRLDADGALRWRVRCPADGAGRISALVSQGDALIGVGEVAGPDARTDLEVLAIGDDGTQRWEHRIHEDGVDLMAAAVLMNGESIVAVGRRLPKAGEGARQMAAWGLSGHGELRWRRTYGGGELDQGVAVAQGESGLFLLGSAMRPGPGKTQAWVVKIGTEGEPAWEHLLGK